MSSRFGLNPEKPNNYAFFCPETKLHLTLSNPVGYADRITSAIKRGLDSKVLIQLKDPIAKREPVREEKIEKTTGVNVTVTTEQSELNEYVSPKRGRRKKEN